MLHFRTLAEMNDAGYACKAFDINTDLDCYLFRGETFRVSPTKLNELNQFVPTLELFQNETPNLKLAKIEDVRANAFIRKKKWK